jgi:hypothetical protein
MLGGLDDWVRGMHCSVAWQSLERDCGTSLLVVTAVLLDGALLVSVAASTVWAQGGML